jgi:hypothetical protein
MAGKLKRYSVLLQYPEWIACDGPETFYHWVMAHNPEEAAVKAIKAAVKHNHAEFFDEDDKYCDAQGSPLDFSVELVVPGWIRGTGVDGDKVRDGINKWAAKLKGELGCEKQKKQSSRVRGSRGSTRLCPAKRARRR